VAAHDGVVLSARAGIVTACDVEAVGRAGMILGAGRARSDDVIDLAVGFELEVRPGDRVEVGQPLARAAYNDAARFEAASRALVDAFTLGDKAPAAIPLVRERLG
jgi:thymidine phosphorylase